MPYCSYHARTRAYERLGVEPTDADWQAAVMSILATLAGSEHTALFQSKTGENAEIWRVKLAGHEVSVVYIPETASIVTVMSKDMSRGKHLMKRYAKRMG